MTLEDRAGTTPAMDAQRDEIRDLVWEWSPLGDDDPFDPHLPRDEYDWLVREVEQKLAEGVDAEQLSAYMTDAVRSRYGLDAPPPVEGVAARLVASGNRTSAGPVRRNGP
jgi:hypothetical protein